MLASIHHLDAEAVLIEGDASDLFAVRGHGRHGFVFLGKFLGGLGKPLRQPVAGIANGVDDLVDGTGATDPGQIRPEAGREPPHTRLSGLQPWKTSKASRSALRGPKKALIRVIYGIVHPVSPFRADLARLPHTKVRK